jgi:serine/threonine-protein kinase
MSLRSRQRLGQYRIEARLASGGFADVYRAYDTVEGIRVALKVPHPGLVDRETLETFRREVRLVAGLDHPNVLPIKTAGMIEGQFVIVTPLGQESLADRLQRRLSRRKALGFMGQLLSGLAFAHRRRIAHLDIKPENLVLFPEDRLRLADFGLARVVARTMRASGSGTVGYLSPEQAMGKPSLRSDVFSAGLVMWRLMGGRLPEWPFERPYPNHAHVAGRWHTGMIRIVLRATEVDERRRFASAVPMLQAFQRVERRAILP